MLAGKRPQLWAFANTVSLGKTPHVVSADQGLHCLPWFTDLQSQKQVNFIQKPFKETIHFQGGNSVKRVLFHFWTDIYSQTKEFAIRTVLERITLSSIWVLNSHETSRPILMQLQITNMRSDLIRSSASTMKHHRETHVITKNYELTHCRLETPKRALNKQCRPRSDAAKCRVWS